MRAIQKTPRACYTVSFPIDVPLSSGGVFPRGTSPRTYTKKRISAATSGVTINSDANNIIETDTGFAKFVTL
eukprot:m.84129 g.84129  ORF g.84129 m.84129 type:complete len:72 (-) comp25712_c0_seq1:799-1014(-)